MATQVGVPFADIALADATQITDTGRADPFQLADPLQLNEVFRDGFE